MNISKDSWHLPAKDLPRRICVCFPHGLRLALHSAGSCLHCFRALRLHAGRFMPPGLSAAPGKSRRATVGGAAFILSQFRIRESQTIFAEIGFLLAQFRERESRAPFAGIAFCADHTPVHRRPTGRPALLYRSRQFGFASRLRGRAAGAAGRQSTACHRTPVHRRPTGRPARSGPPPRSRRATARLARAQKSAPSRQRMAFIICPCTGVRLDARPGQGRPRGGVHPPG